LQDLGTHVLKDISQPEPIHQLSIIGLADEFPPLNSLEARPNNLPVQATPFMGRTDELAALDNLISDPENRVISILGAGGMGKTRLAVAVAEKQLHTFQAANGNEEARFPDGVFFVHLASLETTDAILPTIGKATGFQFYEGADPKKQLLDYLRRKQLLLVMDNFEHLLRGATVLVDIVGSAPDVKILVTSREKLNLQIEVPYNLLGMRFPEGDVTSSNLEPFSAVELFLQRTRRIHPGFIPDKEASNSIGHICRLVEGMPLGVELAAAWMELLSPAEIASEIQRSLDFLEAEKIDVPSRHRSIRAVFDTTWDRLSEDEQEILKKISVFRGGFTTEAARDVAGASYNQLLGLVNKSLLQRSSAYRLSIHELLRQYAEELLNQDQNEKDEVRDLHCAYFADFLHEREPAIDGGDIRDALEEMDNLRIAWEWVISSERFPEIRKQIHSMYILHDFQGWYMDAETTFKRAADRVQQRTLVGARGIVYGILLAYLGFFSFRCGKEREGIEIIRKGQRILQELEANRELAIANFMFGFLCNPEDFRHARDRLLESLEYYSGKENSWEIACLLNTLGNIEFNDRYLKISETYFHKSLEISVVLNNRRSIAWSKSMIGIIAREQGLYQKSKEHVEQAYAIFNSIGYKNIAGMALVVLGEIHILLGELNEAKQRFLQAISIFQSIGQLKEEGDSLQGLGDVAFAEGDYEEARVCLSRSLEHFREVDDLTHSGYVLGKLGKVSAIMGQDQDAQNYIREAIEIGLKMQYPFLCLAIIEGATRHLVAKGNYAKAVELAAMVSNHRFSHADTRENAHKTLLELRKLLEHGSYIAAEERGRNLDPLNEIEVLHCELGEISKAVEE
jgi:predicted ATPase